jgi:hypothetical protein
LLAPAFKARGQCRLALSQTHLAREDMAMSQMERGKDFNIEALLDPASAFRTPMEVVRDPNLTIQEKRAILAAWASDACALEASPELRQLASAEPVQFDEIMDALKCLDGETTAQPNYAKFINRQLWIRWARPFPTSSR